MIKLEQERLEKEKRMTEIEERQKQMTIKKKERLAQLQSQRQESYSFQPVL